MTASVAAMQVWERRAALAGQAKLWGAGSVVVGGAIAGIGTRRKDPRLRAFGLQNAAWGAIDVAIGLVAERILAAKLTRRPDPTSVDVLCREQRLLARELAVSVTMDVGYVLAGFAWRRRHGGTDPKARGNGTAVLVQGGFLLIFDSAHAIALGRDSAGTHSPG